MTITEVISKFNTTPFLFVGSGMTRRYFNLPDWKGLLEHFAQAVNNDPFAYSYYENRAKTMDCAAGIMPKIAELIQYDYDAKWFKDSSIRTVDAAVMDQIKLGLSPFKAEIAAFIRKNCVINADYQSEIEKLAEISEKSVAGVITTNYDTFLEDHFKGFTKFVGQNQLIFSSIQGVAEIYKIHGSIEIPNSIVINEADYVQFESKSAYLAAKLMTIFMEYPIIFMGYSISDSNIQNIIRSIVNCLDEEQIKKLEDRFVFVEYKPDAVGVDVTPYTIMVDGKPLSMRKVVLSDFLPLYVAISNKQAKLPVRILRRFKEELYTYVVTNTPTATLRVASIDDNRLGDEEMVLAIGRADQFGLRGLSGINDKDWYRNIVLDDIEFTSDELLEHAFPSVWRQNSGTLPVNKYLASATKSFPQCEAVAQKQDFNAIISNTIRKFRQARLGTRTSVKEIWEEEKNQLDRATASIAHLSEEAFNVQELEDVLKEIFTNSPDILVTGSQTERTNIRRLIRIYDYLKWGKK